jgi:hypothetical protein
MYVFGGRGGNDTDLGDLITFKLSSKSFGMLIPMRPSFIHDIQPSNGSSFKIRDQVQAKGGVMVWLLMGHGSFCLEENQ